MTTSLTKASKRKLTDILRSIGQESALGGKGASNETVLMRHMWSLLTQGHIQFGEEHVIYADAATWINVATKVMEFTDGKPGMQLPQTPVGDDGVDTQMTVQAWQQITVQRRTGIDEMMDQYDDEIEVEYAPIRAIEVDLDALA